jgi:hypothetical protein
VPGGTGYSWIVSVLAAGIAAMVAAVGDGSMDGAGAVSVGEIASAVGSTAAGVVPTLVGEGPVLTGAVGGKPAQPARKIVARTVNAIRNIACSFRFLSALVAWTLPKLFPKCLFMLH